LLFLTAALLVRTAIVAVLTAEVVVLTATTSGLTTDTLVLTAGTLFPTASRLVLTAQRPVLTPTRTVPPWFRTLLREEFYVTLLPPDLLWLLRNRRGHRFRFNTLPLADTRQQVGLLRLERNQPAQHVQHVEQFRGVFRQPAIRLNLAQLGR